MMQDSQSRWRLLFLFMIVVKLAIYQNIDSYSLTIQRNRETRFLLYPISKENLQEMEISFDSNWNFHLLEKEDIKRATDLSTDCFYKPKVLLARDGMSKVELAFFGGIEKVLHSFDKTEEWISNYLGYRMRGGKRLSFPSFQPSADAIILAATHVQNPKFIVGMIELSLEKPNGLLPIPHTFPQPINNLSVYEPYLSNLCVDPSQRRKGLSRKLCQILEEIVRSVYKKSSIYLHVLEDNEAARSLYASLGYQPISVLTNDEIRRYRMEKVCYYKKDLQTIRIH